MQKMRDQIKDEEIKQMMDADDYDDNDSDHKINQNFKGGYNKNHDVSDSADVSMEEGGNDQQELDDDEDSQELDENLNDDDDDKDF